MSSLAAQLAQNASLNSSLLVDRSRRKPTASYLFTGKEVDRHDLDAIHALGVNSLLHLASVVPALEKYEDVLFSERAKETDRTLLPSEAVAELDGAIEEFLWLLSPYLMEAPTGKILEWLVRRFRINEFNVDSTLTLFLPYHETPHFAKMVTILHFKPNSIWSFLNSYKSAAQNVPRVSLVTEMLKNQDLARFVASVLPTAIKKGLSHHVLLAFNAATLHDFIKRSKSITEGTVAYLLPALLEPLQQKSKKPKKLSKDAVLGSYILLASLSQKCEMSASALTLIVGAVASCAEVVRGDQFVSSVIAICEPQPELERLTAGTLKAILRIPTIKEDLASGTTWAGSEKILIPLVKGLSYRLEDSLTLEVLQTLIATSTVPFSVIEILATKLLHTATKPDCEPQDLLIARRLLSSIQQRHPTLLRKAAETLCDNDASLKEAVEQQVISISTIGHGSSSSTTTAGMDLILGSSNADVNVRTMAVKALVKSVADKELSKIEDMETIRNALIARIQDSHVDVLEALYGNHAAITPLFASDPKSYLSSLSLAMESQSKPKRDIIRLHTTFIASSFWADADTTTREEIFHNVLFPFLLYSKSRQKRANIVWEIINQHLLADSAGVLSEWLAGCADIVANVAASSGGVDSVELLNQTNFDLAEKFADNILVSDHLPIHLDSLVSKLEDARPHVKLLGYLIALALIKKMSGQPQIEMARRVVDILGLSELPDIDDLSQDHLALESPEDRSLGKYIVTKPNSNKALHWLQILLLAAVSRITSPSDVVFDWVSEANSTSQDSAQRYIYLMRSIYQLANASSNVPILATTVLKILFISLKGDALAFLAGIWATGGKEDFQESRAIALLHAAAFLEAHILEDDGMDFQTILPTLLSALQNPDQAVSQGALECISRVRILAGRKLTSVYRFDAIYGHSDRTLQYLDQEDLKRYLDALVEHRDHFVNDASYLKVFQESHLGRAKSDKKKDADYKHRIVCYLLSHINALSCEEVRNALLRSTATITNKAKVQILLPTLQTVVEKASTVVPANTFSATSEELTTRLLSCFDTAAAPYLNDTPVASATLFQTIRTYLRPGTPLPAQKALVHCIESGLFASLNQKHKIALCEALLDVGSQGLSAQSLARQALSKILVDVPLIVHLLESFTPAAPSTRPRASKRVKTAESPEDTLPRLSLLVEILGTKPLPGSLDLIAHLLETLNKIVQSLPQTQADVNYIEQLLMSAVESAASNINEVPNLSPSVIRLDILVEVIRVSGNPQTFHQALLLIANLARLAPDSVLYNVMPVFTFMGSNVFHRDDSYSFKVVQQTIDGIIPVMVSSLKGAHSQPLDLYLAAKEFLRVFTDAANHIPRHRRNNFFGHLVDVLGSREFSAPVCMLLLEKSANRVIRQTSADDVHASLSLPIFVFQHSNYVQQIYIANEILSESHRIVAHIVDPNSIQPIFLEGLADGDHSVSSSSILRRRAQALIIFVGHAFKPKASATKSPEGEGSISTVITQLIKLATLPEGKATENKVEEISDAARSSMNKLLSSMSVLDFIDTVHSMLGSGDTKVQAGALELLARRLLNVSPKLRPEITPTVIKILVSVKNLLATQKDGQVVIHAFHASKSIAATMSPGEEGPLTDLVPHMFPGDKEQPLVAPALAALSSLSVKLGPRIIPFFRTIISQIVAIIRGPNSVLFDDAFSILHGLLTSIPTFWGTGEVTQVVFLYMDLSSSQSKPLVSALTSISKSLAKRIPAKVLLPTLLDMWKPSQSFSQLTKVSAYFEVLARALHYADRPAVLEHLRTMFKLFIEALDLVKVDEVAETRVIAAFKELVVKLNEAAFKPLFRRLYDWAFVEKSDDDFRKVAFNHLYIGLLVFFKGLMVPYMSFLLQPFSDLLTSFTPPGPKNVDLWTSVLETLTHTLNFDDGGFWRDDKLRQISVPLSAQIDVCVKANFTDGKGQLQDCLGALVENVTDDALLKSINLNILMHTRSEDARVRIFALSCSNCIWRSNGGKLIGFVAETATFIAECGEDENDTVVKESFKLKEAVESIAGTIEGL